MATIYHLHFYVKACLHFDQYSRVFFFFFFTYPNSFLKFLSFTSGTAWGTQNLHIIIIIDDAKKISRLSVPGFNGLVIAWKA